MLRLDCLAIAFKVRKPFAMCTFGTAGWRLGMSYALDVTAPAEREHDKAAAAPEDAAVVPSTMVPWSESAATVPDSAPVADGVVFDEDRSCWIVSRLAMRR